MKPIDPGHDDPFVASLLPLDDRPGPARRLPAAVVAQRARAAVAAALAADLGPAGDPVEYAELKELPPPPPPQPVARPVLIGSRARRRMGLAVAAAALFALTVGGAATALARRNTSAPIRRFELPPAPTPRVPARRTVVPPPPPPAEEVAPEPAPTPGPAPARRPAPRRHTLVLEQAPVEDLLALANDRRRDRDWTGADEYYRAAVRRFPGSDAAVVAEVASAMLHLQQLGDAQGALAGYRRALASRPTGAVSEEARWGLAEAHRALGHRREEAAALTEFLRYHPGSALTPTARRRLQELRL